MGTLNNPDPLTLAHRFAANSVPDLSATDFTAKGECLLRAGRFEELLSLCDHVLAADRTCREGWRFKGDVLRRIHKNREALKAYTHIVEIDPSDALGLSRSSITLGDLQVNFHALAIAEYCIEKLDNNLNCIWAARSFALGRLDRGKEALVAAQRCLDLDATDPLGWHFKGYALYRLGRHAEAIEMFDRVIELDPWFPMAWNNKAFNLSALGRHHEALTVYEHVLEFSPQFALGWKNKGNVLRALQRHEEAGAAFERAAHIEGVVELDFRVKYANASTETGWEEFFAVWAQAFVGVGHFEQAGSILHYALKRYEDALTAYDRALALDPKTVAVWNRKADILVTLRRHEEALAAYDQALALNEGDVGVWTQRAELLWSLQRWEEAVDSYDRALSLDPEATPPMRLRFLPLLGSTLLTVKQRRAILLREAGTPHGSIGQTFGTDGAPWWLNQARLHLLGNRDEQALLTCKRSLEVDAKFDARYIKLAAWSTMATVLHRLQRHDESLVACERALEQTVNSGFEFDPEVLAVCNSRAKVLQTMGRHEEALQACNRALEIDPNNSAAWSTKGKALEDLQRGKEAIAVYDYILAIDSTNAQAQEARNRVAMQISSIGSDSHLKKRGLFRRIFGLQPKEWKHPDPAVRVLAVRRLTNQYVLGNIVRNDQDPVVRMVGVERLTDQAVLHELAATHKVPSVRTSTVKKLTDMFDVQRICREDGNLSVKEAARKTLNRARALSSSCVHEWVVQRTTTDRTRRTEDLSRDVGFRPNISGEPVRRRHAAACSLRDHHQH